MTTSHPVGKVALCTGANRGLGFAILQVAGHRDPSTVFILSCRDLESGHAAKEQLAKEGIKAQIDVIQLDTTNDEQIIEAVKFVETKYGKLDGASQSERTAAPRENTLAIGPHLDFVLCSTMKVGRLTRDSPHQQCWYHDHYTGLLSAHPSKNMQQHAGCQSYLPCRHLHCLFAPSAQSSQTKSDQHHLWLGSMKNTLTKKMPRYAPYGISKVGTNGLTAHMQAAENDRIATEEAEGKGKDEGRIVFYSAAPGLLRTAFTHYSAQGKDPKDGAEVIVRLMADEKGAYEGGSQYEFEEGEMRLVPW